MSKMKNPQNIFSISKNVARQILIYANCLDVEITKPPDIMKHIEEFYLSLVKASIPISKTEKDCLENLHNINISQLSQSESKLCEGLLMKREYGKALSLVKNNEALGMMV